METTKKNALESIIGFGEGAIVWIGFLLMQVIIITTLCSLFIEYDTALNIAWGTATPLTLISAVNKNVRWCVIGVAMILMLIIGVVAFFDVFGTVAHLYRIGTGR